MILVIAEKPQLGKAIADALPGRAETKDSVIVKGDYTIVWAYGHLLTLKDPEDYDEKYTKWSIEDLPIYFDNWGMKIGETQNKIPGQQSKAQRVKQIGELIKQADSIIHAGDVDEEGQLLIDELLRWFKYKGPVMRLDTSNTAAPALQKALKRMKDNKSCEADGWSAFGRELSDAIFGFNLTRYFTVKNNTFLTVGRVQTPTLGLVVRRDELIESHKKIVYYELFAGLSLAGTEVETKFEPDPQNPALENGRFLNRSYLDEREKSINGSTYSGIEVKKSKVKEAPPLPFNLTKLTSYCSKRWGYNPDDVMRITQSLRENYKAITYNRSDCQYLSEEHFKEAPETVAAAAKNLGIDVGTFDTSIKSRCFNDANITAHFAIIPTSEAVSLEKMTDRERNVYTAICHYYLAQFMPPAEKERTSLRVHIDKGEHLTASSSVILKPGYRALLTEQVSLETDDGEDNEKNTGLSGIAAGEYTGKVVSTDIREKETKPPSRYTQASLAEDMTRIAKYIDDPAIKQLLLDKDKDKKGENGSIGTSATRPFIIKNLISRGYLFEKKEGKRTVLISTPKGRDFYNMLPSDIKEADTTAKWWVMQEDIKTGATTPEKMAKDVLYVVQRVISSGAGALSNATAYANGGTGLIVGRCPICNHKVVETPKTYSCNRKGCPCVFFKENKLLKSIGAKMSVDLVKALLENDEVLLKNCKSRNTGNTFNCVLKVNYGEKYANLSIELDDTSLGRCPICGGEVIETSNSFSCSKEGCSFVFFKDNKLLESIGKKMSSSIVKNLLAKGEAPLKNCKSKNSGNLFNCILKVEYSQGHPEFSIELDDSSLGRCPICSSDVIEVGKTFACSKEECSFVLFKENKFLESIGKKMSASIVKSLLDKGEALLKDCKSEKSGNIFDCVLRCNFKVEDGDFSPEFSIDLADTSFGKCPICGGNVTKNKFGNYSCDNWKQNCKFTIYSTVAGKKLSEANIKDLLTKGETPELHGFKSNKGFKFDAKLVLGPDNKVSFKFVDHPRKR